MPFSILCVIPARAGSRGLRDKNIQRVGGVPMMARAVALAHGSIRRREVWHIVVSTESPFYARLARRAGAEVLHRPQRLATSRARLADVILHALDRCGPEFDAVLMLSAATPLTEPRDVRRAVALVKRHGGSAVSVTREPFPTSWRFAVDRGCLVVPRGTRVGRRQQAELQYRLNGAVFMTSPTRLRRYGQFVAPGDTRAVIMPRERSVDVEDEFDLDWARFLWSRQDGGKQPKSLTSTSRMVTKT